MKITAIQTSNFLGARAVDVKLTKPITLFAGKNGAGKSSLSEAVRMALTGESVRVGLKKEYGQLVTEGANSGFAEIEINGTVRTFVTLPDGKTTPLTEYATPTALPYVLDAQRFARLDTNERRAFLFGLMGLKTDGPAVRERLLAKECDAAKIEAVAPFLRAGFDAAQKEAQGKARESKAQWKTTTGGETYGAVKAASWQAKKPEADAGALQDARADLAAIEREIEQETTRLGELQGKAKQAAEQQAKLNGLRQQASQYARAQDKLNRDEAELKEWERKVEETRAKASGTSKHDPLTCPHCGGLVEIDNDDAGQPALYAYEPPASAPNPEAKAKLPEYEKALKLCQNMVANGKRDLEAADTAARALKEIEEAGLIEAPADDEIAHSKSRVDGLKHDRANQQAAIRLLEDAIQQALVADERTQQAAALHNDVQQWEAIADALAPDGIPGEMLAEALGPINDRLRSSSVLSEWEQVTISPDMWITYGGREYNLISESEKWRADAMIAEAVAKLSGIRLLVLDRFDVLDSKGREDLLYWLDGESGGDLETVMLFGTLKALPAQLPETIEAVWIENGVAGKVEAAA